jgi:hypothetical protein
MGAQLDSSTHGLQLRNFCFGEKDDIGNQTLTILLNVTACAISLVKYK